jgi:Ca-activated chloride channel homolog
MSFALPVALLLVPLPIAVLVAWTWAMQRSRKRAVALSRVAPARPPYLAALLLSIAATVGIVAAAQPRWGTEEVELEREGVDVLFVLDVSRGMAAEDVAPSRFRVLRDAVEASLHVLDGDRVGLIAVGGTASLRFPVTTDTTAASDVLRTLEPGSIFVGPGTDLASGLDLARDLLATSEADSIVVLLTDGDQLAAADPVAAAAALGEAGIELLVVGAGTIEGGVVPVYDRFEGAMVPLRTRSGDPVITRLNEPLLSGMANAAGGIYVGADPTLLPSTLAARIDSMQRARIDTRSAEIPVERFQWFAGAALALLVLAWVTERLPILFSRRRMLGATALSALLVVVACAEEGYELNEEGLHAYERGDYFQAAELFREAERASPEDFQVSLNLASALYAAGDFDRAIGAARRALDSSRPERRASAYSIMGHSSFAAGDLVGALDGFRFALREAPSVEYRHNYEVVLRLLQPDDVEDEPGDDPDTNGNGDGDPDAEPGNDSPGPAPPPNGSDNGDEPGDDQEPSSPQTVSEVDEAIAGIDELVNELQPPEGRELTVAETLEILELLAERARLAALRESLSSTISPDDY